MKKMQNRLTMSRPYSEKIDEIIEHLSSGGVDTNLDLLKLRENPRRSLIVIVAGNRGLCGGFNTNVVEMALDKKDELLKQGREQVKVYVFGKKAYSYLKFLKEPIFKWDANPEDKISFTYASELGLELVEQFERREVDEVFFVYTKVKSSASQKPTIVQLLPIVKEEEGEHKGSVGDYIFDPSPEEILSTLIPLYIRVKIFSFFLESNFSEQFARRVAMKNANDAAADMVRGLTVFYNRVRQAKITNEIAEIVGGAAALD
jgi:F-type H+-transporting ATPase subunit gamma